MNSKIRVAILGYGNLGRGVEAAMPYNPDVELVGVFTRRPPDQVKTLTDVPVYHVDELLSKKSDIDVLIRKDCFDKAAEELKSMGYVLDESIKHHDIYKKLPHMVVEAHRAMYDKTVDYTQYEYFSNLSKAVLREGCSYIYDFTTEDFYLYMIAHMAKHFYAKGCGIRNIVDIYVYRKKFADVMDYKYVTEELAKLGLSTFTKHMETLAEIWLCGKEGDGFYDQLFEYMLDSGIYGKDENGIWNKFCEEQMKDKEPSRLQLKWWYWFPPPLRRRSAPWTTKKARPSWRKWVWRSPVWIASSARAIVCWVL